VRRLRIAADRRDTHPSWQSEPDGEEQQLGDIFLQASAFAMWHLGETDGEEAIVRAACERQRVRSGRRAGGRRGRLVKAAQACCPDGACGQPGAAQVEILAACAENDPY